MNIDKSQIIDMLKSQGQGDKADQASSQLPDQVDTDKPEHQGLLSKLGIDPSKLGGLGGMASKLL